MTPLGSRAGPWQACGVGKLVVNTPALSFRALPLVPWLSPPSLLQSLSANVFPCMFPVSPLPWPPPSVPKEAGPALRTGFHLSPVHLSLNVSPCPFPEARGLSFIPKGVRGEQ